jgi:hypothetical protein
VPTECAQEPIEFNRSHFPGAEFLVSMWSASGPRLGGRRSFLLIFVPLEVFDLRVGDHAQALFRCRSDPVESLSCAADFSSGQAHSPLSLGSRVPQADLLSARQTLFHLIFLNKPPVLLCLIPRFFYFWSGDSFSLLPAPKPGRQLKSMAA